LLLKRKLRRSHSLVPKDRELLIFGENRGAIENPRMVRELLKGLPPTNNEILIGDEEGLAFSSSSGNCALQTDGLDEIPCPLGAP
jgi:hypothetical protein